MGEFRPTIEVHGTRTAQERRYPMRASVFLLGLVVAGVSVVSSVSGQTSLKPQFTGTWQLAPDKSDIKGPKLTGMTLTIDHPDKTDIHIVEVVKGENGQEKKREYRCSTMGKECDLSEGSQVAKLSMYYNGSKLVAIERDGKDSDTIVKRTYELSEDGKSLNIEVTPMVPPHEVDKLVLTKQAT